MEMRSKPYFYAAIALCAIGTIILLLAVISFLNGDDSITSNIAALFHIDESTVKNETIAQAGAAFFIPAFMLAFFAFCDNNRKHNN